MPAYSPAALDDLEQLVLSGFTLNNDVDLDLEAAEFTPAKPVTDWQGGPDSEGTRPAGEDQWTNAELLLRMRVRRQSSTDAALDKLHALAAVLGECFRTDDGLPLEWTPNNGTRTTTFYVLRGFIDGVPITHEGDDTGWLQRTPVVTVRLVMRPFGEGTEIVCPTVTSTAPLIEYEVDTTTDGFDTEALDLSPLALFSPAGSGVTDLVGDYTATLHNGAAVNTAELIHGTPGAVTFDAVDDYVSTDITGVFTNGLVRTLVIVAQRGNGSDFMGLVGSSNVGAHTVRVYLGTSDDANRINVEFQNGGAVAQFYPPTGESVFRPFMLALVLDEPGNLVTAYFNGQSLGSVAMADAYDSPGASLEIGRLAPGTFPYTFGGYIARVGVYNGALTAAQIARLQLARVDTTTGDVPSTGRLIVGDNATKNRDHVEWGIEALDAAGGPDLWTNASGFLAQASSSQTRSGSVGSNVRRVILTPGYQSCFGWDGITNVGRFRVRLRVYIDGEVEEVTTRLGYRSGDGPLSYCEPVANQVAYGWQELDLGVVDLKAARAGTQSSDLRIEAKAPNVMFDGDALYLIPVSSGYGKARADARAALQAVTTYNARDEFEQAAGNLNGVAAPTGGNWATAGSTTDFSIHADDYLYRATTSDSGPRRAILGTSIADQVVSATFGQSGRARMGLIARYVDANNYLVGWMDGASGGYGLVRVEKVVAGVTTTIGGAFVNPGGFLSLTVDASGEWTLRALAFVIQQGQDADLATGGALASGKGGLYDYNTLATASIRTFDNFAFVAYARSHALNSGRTIEFRSDSTLRYDSSGTILGEPPQYRGSRFLVPQAGSAGKVARVAVKARRSDVDASADLGPTDSTTVSVAMTPRFILPR